LLRELGSWEIDREGEAVGVTLLDGLALVAQRQGGLAAVDYSNPYSPRRVGRLGGPWWIYQAAAAAQHLYLAAGHSGVLVVRRQPCPEPAHVPGLWLSP
jgi:hypothetical protein